jgi:C-terminal processing protease CtpA/Prc
MKISTAIAICASVLLVGNVAGQSECRQGPPSIEETLELRGVPVAYVDRVEPNSSAERAGLSPGDLVVGFNGQDMRSFPGFESYLAELRLAAITDKAVIDILKYEPSSESYVPAAVTVILVGTKERYVGFNSHFAYFIRAVTAGGLAERMGARPGDFLEKVSGQRVGNLRAPLDLDLIASEAARKSEGKLELSLSRWRPMKDGTIHGETREVKRQP